MRTSLLLLGLILFQNAGLAVGQERLPFPKETAPAPPQPEALPLPPGIVIRPAAPPPVGVAFYRVSAYQHWQYLTPDIHGRWSPRVLMTPDGPVWAATGQPYLFGTTIRPNSVGSPGSVPAP